jgi:hypothetical protein
MTHEDGKADTPKKEIGFDESFKILATHFFSEFSKIVTDYEIINLPKKADLLVVETDKPITNYVKIFDYFKTFNIIEFKSAQDPFRIDRDIPKILVYIGGILLAEKKGFLENTTFSIISSRKPVKLFKVFKKYIHKVKNGVYLLKLLVQVPVYIVAANEIPYSPQLESGNCLHNSGSVNKETALVKAFSTGRERIHFLTSILHEVLKGNRSLKEYVHFAFLLYKNEMKQIVEKEGISMTIGEKNIREWVDVYFFLQ